MDASTNLYERYTSTSALASSQDPSKILCWSKGYFRANFAALLPENKNAKILEVGCGYGRYLLCLAEMGFSNCYGIDISREQITYAKDSLNLKNVEEADAFLWLNDKESVYDCILCIDILEHFSTHDLLILGEKVCSALKPDGVAIFQIPNGMSPLNPIIYGDLTHVRAFTPQSMQQFFLNIGLAPLRYLHIPPHIYNITSLCKRIIWTFFIQPLIHAIVLTTHGRVFGGNIYTSNFIAYAKRKPV